MSGGPAPARRTGAARFVAQAGVRVGPWTLRRPLGRGDFGSAWRATHADGRVAAVKLLDAPPGDEVRALGRVCHPCVVGVLDAGVSPTPYLALELAPGRTLSSMIQRATPPLDRALRIVALVADALASVHDQGLVHGDVKPANIVVDRISSGRVHLVDFGMAGHAHGGTLAYAAPERTWGADASAAGDVYALGLVFWELLHGRRPHAEHDLGSALALRREAPPEPTQGPTWARELLRGMLAPGPEQRPVAADVADALAAHGIALASVDLAFVRRRARRAHRPVPAVDGAVRAWLSAGGDLALVGPSRSGRTHHVEAAVLELQARGVPLVRMQAALPPWAGIEQALRDPSLPGRPVALPAASTVEERARLASLELADRSPGGLAVVVDDLDRLDAGSAAVLEALGQLGRVRILVAGGAAPPWIDRVVSLEPLLREEIAPLLVGILGDVVGLDALERRAWELSHGLPGRVVTLVLAAIDQGALEYQRRRWVVVPSRLASLTDQLAAPDPALLGDAALQLGARVAVEGVALPLADLAALVGREVADGLAADVAELVGHGFLRVDGDIVRCVDEPARRALIDSSPDPTWLHAQALHGLLGLERVPWMRAGWHLVGADSEDLVRRHGPAAIEAVGEVDPTEAARLSTALWASAPLPELAGPHADALVAAGRVDEARALAETLLSDGDPAVEDVPLLIALARIEVHLSNDFPAADALLERAWACVGDDPPLSLVVVTANACFRAERLDEAVQAARTVAEAPPPLQPRALDAWLMLRGVWAQARHRQGQTADAIAILESVSEEVGRGRSQRAIFDATCGRLLWHGGRIRDAAAAFERASAAEGGLPALERARLLNNAALARYQLGDLQDALDAWEKALVLSERLGSTMEQVRIQTNLCAGYREVRRWERARQAGEWAESHARELGASEYQAMAAGNLGELHATRGEVEQAERWYRVTRAVATRAGLRSELAELARREAQLAVHADRPDARAQCREARQAAVEAGARLEEARALALEAICAGRAGDAEAADELLHHAEYLLRAAGTARDIAEVRLCAGLAHRSLGRDAEARSAFTAAVQYAAESGQVHLRHQAQDCLDQLHGAGRVVTREERQAVSLLRMAAMLQAETDTDAVLRAIADAALDVLDAERAFVLLGPHAEQVGARRCRDGASPGQPSRSIVERAVAARREVIAVDIDERRDLRMARSVRELGIRSAMCVPMVHDDQLVGAIYVDSRTATERGLAAASELMSLLADNAAAAVIAARRSAGDRQRSRLAAELAHDLRNPAGAILSLARESGADHAPEWQEAAELAERILHMVTGWLDQTPGKQGADDLVDIGRRLARLHARAAAAREVELEVVSELQQAPVDAVAGDLERALDNLIANALRYAPAGSAVTCRVEEAGQGFCFSVRDRGPGISPAQQAEVFESGFRGDDAGEGHGLGLAIVRRIIGEHGGHVSVGNHPGGGAVFQVWLPRR